MNKIIKTNDFYRPNDCILNRRISSKIEIYNDAGELIFEPLHNKTVIAGSALVAMKMFNLNRSVLNNTPTYENLLGGLSEGSDGTSYPSITIKDNLGNDIGTAPNESDRRIVGFCVGNGGSGLGISDIYNVKYCDHISANNIIPFRYPLSSADDVDETIYKGKKVINIGQQQRIAYYFKTFSNDPVFFQNYANNAGVVTGEINPSTVYTNIAEADNGQTCIELHLQITKEDCREFFIAHSGLENAVINQISLVSAWTKKNVSVSKPNANGVLEDHQYDYFQDIRPFSLLNIPNDGISDLSKSISIIYTLYF